MTYGAQLTAQLAAAAQPHLAGMASAVNALRHAQAAFREADDMVPALRGMTGLILALEAAEDAAKASAAALRVAMAAVMEDSGCTSFETEHHTASLADAPQLAVVNDAKALPVEYLKQADPTPDRAAIRRALLAGNTVPGAGLSNGGASILKITNRSK